MALPQVGETYRHYPDTTVRVVGHHVNTFGETEVVTENLDESADRRERTGQQYRVSLSDFGRLLTWNGRVSPGIPLYRKLEV
jgi:hypothetical protein